MSVLPLKPDIDRSHRDVCLMPTADISWVCSAIDSRSDRTVKIREFVPHSDKKRVTIERHCCRESHPDAEEMTVSLLRERPAVSRRRRSNRPGNSQADEPRNA